jgi:hypothetical protein
VRALLTGSSACASASEPCWAATVRISIGTGTAR